VYVTEQNVIAILFDCDDTLCEDATTFVLKRRDVDVRTFWESVDKLVREGWDPPLAYMDKIIQMVQSGQMSDLTNERLRRLGADVEFFPGIPQMFDELKELISQTEEFQEAGVTLEYYVISSGFEEVIRGSKIAKFMKDIFACTFAADPKTGVLRLPKSIVTFTEKTKFVFAVNKGIPGSVLRKRPYEVNNVISEGQRRVPFRNMIYVGDGPSDIPCFSLITKNGGHGIGVFKREAVKKGYQLAKGKRLTVGPYPCDYREGQPLRTMLEHIIREIGLDIALRRQRRFVSAPRYS